MATPKIIPYDVELRSVNPVRSFDRPKAYTNDLNSVEFQFKALDMTSTELTTATAVTLVYMRDGSFFANPSTDVSRVGNVFSYLLKENEGNHAGVAQIQLVVTVDGMELASQLFDFEIINGLETKVAQEVMIYDWTTLTRDAQDYIDQFVANEATRQQQFADAQTQRGTTFGESEAGRTTTFNASEAERTTTFNASEAGRTTAFTAAEEARATGYDADHSRAGTDHTTAVNDHALAGTDHTTAANDHTLAGTDHTRAESDHTRADADSATVAGFNARVLAEETATANNKISAVKGKTFADVDARLEDVETDTTMMGTNKVTNGDFSNGITGWTTSNTYTFITNGIRMTFVSGTNALLAMAITNSVGDVLYIKAGISTDITNGVWAYSNYELPATQLFDTKGSLLKTTTILNSLVFGRNSALGTYLEVKSPIVLNLTTIFGAGNEPTAEQMDGIMAKFTNSWFNGTANLFRANAALNKLMAVDARTEFEAKNEVANGDFSNGTTGWSSLYAVNSITDGKLINTGDGTNANVQLLQNTGFIAPPNNVYYFKAKVKVTNSSCTAISYSIYAPGGLSGSQLVTANPVINTEYEISRKITVGSGTYGALHVYVMHLYPDSATANGKIMEVDNYICLNLTKIFGAGKEPTSAEMDRLMARYPNSWFDGVKPIQTIESLYQEKANKVQEAWITPTLLNGWVANVSNPVGYYKDELGEVKFRGKFTAGTIGTQLFVLPVGYRPKYNTRLAISSDSTIGNIMIDTGGGVYCYFGTNTGIQLDSVRFRAEA